MITTHYIDEGKEIEISWIFHDTSFDFIYGSIRGIHTDYEMEPEITHVEGMTADEAEKWLAENRASIEPSEKEFNDFYSEY